MSENMIEHVARALYLIETADAAKEFPLPDGSDGWDGPLLNKRGRAAYRRKARAIMKAMHAPTYGMVTAASERHWDDMYPHTVWAAMIEAALAGK